MTLLPHSAPTWILNPSCALMRARVGYKIRFDQPTTHPDDQFEIQIWIWTTYHPHTYPTLNLKVRMGSKIWLDQHPNNQLTYSPRELIQIFHIYRFVRYRHTRLHLGFSAKLRILQVPACKMEPQSGNISWKNHPATTHPPYGFFLLNILNSNSGECRVFEGCPES